MDRDQVSETANRKPERFTCYPHSVRELRAEIIRLKLEAEDHALVCPLAKDRALLRAAAWPELPNGEGVAEAPHEAERYDG